MHEDLRKSELKVVMDSIRRRAPGRRLREQSRVRHVENLLEAE
jgi:hypothetical protein